MKSMDIDYKKEVVRSASHVGKKQSNGLRTNTIFEKKFSAKFLNEDDDLGKQFKK